MGKKAQMHVEMILSFALFILSITIIFLLLNPISKQSSNKMEINIIQQKILNKISSEVGIMSVITTTENGCYEFPLNYINEYGSEFTEFQQENLRKYNLYFSEDLSNTQTHNIPGCEPTGFSFGVYLTEDLIVYDKINELITEYNSAYEPLKDELRLNNDFTFKFKTKDNVEVQGLKTSKSPPSGINIIANEFPVRVIKSSGEIQELILNIQAW